MKSKKTLVLFLILCFLTVLIVVGSVLFSVKTVVGYCYNADDTELNEQVVEASAAKLKKGSSIFLVRENEIINEVESKLPNVWVINVERVFPSGVYIDYVKIKEYFVAKSGDKLLYVSNNGKILRSSQETASEKMIELRYDGNFDSTATGSTIFRSESLNYELLVNLMKALHRVESEHDNLVEMFEFVDLSFVDKNELFIKTGAGVCIEIQNPEKNMLEKVRFAMSFLNGMDLDHTSKGTITVFTSGDKVKCTWSAEDKYSAIKSQE